MIFANGSYTWCIASREAQPGFASKLDRDGTASAANDHPGSTRIRRTNFELTQLNEVYAGLVGAHLLATVRETWAVAPSLTNVRIVGGRKGVEIDAEILFDVDVPRAEGHWADDNWGEAILEHSEWGLYRTGKTNEVRPWPREQMRPDAFRLWLHRGMYQR